MTELNISPLTENIKTVTGFVNAQLKSLGCPAGTEAQIAIAVDELFGNIVRYACVPGTDSVTVRVETDEAEKAVLITFIDGGRPFDPLSVPTPDISLTAEQRQPGGLGICIVKKIMDDISYEYAGGKNILSVKKRL